MFKITQLLLCLFGTAVPAFAQNAWHLNLPGAPLSNTFCGLGFEGDRYLVHTHASIYELDHLGAVTGNIRLANGPLLWTSVVKRTTVPDGHPYFLVARRPVSQSPTYSLAEYRPGTGFVNEQQVPDSLGSISGQRAGRAVVPVVDWRNDGKYKRQRAGAIHRHRDGADGLSVGGKCTGSAGFGRGCAGGSYPMVGAAQSGQGIYPGDLRRLRRKRIVSGCTAQCPRHAVAAGRRRRQGVPPGPE
ncbi:MAG: hypothetical protein IPH12_04095 [Saprospirales bacterium]|nr:hypothetical protein [Saprospirales bacterium]